jgi:hypothetical protein
MAASTTTCNFIPSEKESALLPASSAPRVRSKRPRYIAPQAGRALEILGHAIEYLTDEFVHESGSLFANDGRIKAVQLLMGLNRQVYFECPEEPTFGERCRSILHPNQAWAGLATRLLLSVINRIIDDDEWRRGSSLTKSQHGPKREPRQTHEVPEPSRGVDGDLAVLDAAEQAESNEAEDQSG